MTPSRHEMTADARHWRKRLADEQEREMRHDGCDCPCHSITWVRVVNCGCAQDHESIEQERLMFVIKCSACKASLAVQSAGEWIEHNADGSHTWYPEHADGSGDD